MAFFKFRKNGAEQSGPSAAPESLEALRRRARHRLIGAAALVLVGVVGFPLLFDSQPRPIAVDIAIDIPDKTKIAPLSASPASAAVHAEPAETPKTSVVASASMAPDVAALASLAVKAAPGLEPSAPASAVAKAASAAQPKAETKPTPKNDAKAPAKVEEKAQQGSKAQALLDGKEPAKPAPVTPRYTVQVGAFADAQKAHEARNALEKAGIKTYTQVVVTPDGKRIRVRAGPWEDKAEAEKTAEKIKKLNLPASVLTL